MLHSPHFFLLKFIMLSYQHGYHAGNYADVVKHLALTCLLDYLTIKDKPLFYLETHSGKGLYDLTDKQAIKTGEFRQGIDLIWNNRTSLPDPFKNYLKVIQQLNSNDQLRYYPGSPYLAINLLRKQDRLYLCELHPNEFEALQLMPHFYKKVHLSHADGIASLKAVLPPPEKRGLIFIDPAYELKDEYKQIPAAIKRAFLHFSNGVFCLWYPVVNRRMTDQLIRRMEEIGAKNNLRIEFNTASSMEDGMSGCGLWIINPPYTLAAQMKSVLDLLKTYFNPGDSSYLIE